MLAYMHAQNTYFHQGSDLFLDLEPYMKQVANQVSEKQEHVSDIITLSGRDTHRYVIGIDLKLLIILLSMWYQENVSLRFSSNTEANAELLNNLEEIFHRYY